ncbi:conserved hypothetical protein [Trichinella spiralis]|uniref:hypothetical protein n=1 Tax=Trichinella spiralis TaxID=6334 RepID=UPI0001EFEF70|nr:conserved hypothetical protein [Trichinella spiralis]
MRSSQCPNAAQFVERTFETGRCVDWIRFSIDDSQATPALFGLFEIIQSTIKLTLERPHVKAAVHLWNRFIEADDLFYFCFFFCVFFCFFIVKFDCAQIRAHIVRRFLKIFALFVIILLAKLSLAYLRASLHAGEWLRRIDDDDDSDSDVEYQQFDTLLLNDR